MNPFHPKYQNCSMQDFKIDEVISRSTNGSVFLGKHQLYNQKFILKEKKVSELGRSKSVLHEVRILRNLKHPNLITCYGYFWKSCQQTRRNLVMILRYYEKEYEVLLTIYQICLGLKYLHEKGVVHRDIKSSNIFISKKNEVVIGDLGISRQVEHENNELIRTFSAGTPIYMSPEVVTNRPYDNRTDVWSLGILLWELMVLKFPFEGDNIQDLLGRICHAKPGGDNHKMYLHEMESRYSKEIIELCTSMLSKNFSQRPNSSKVLETVIQLLSKFQQAEQSDENNESEETHQKSPQRKRYRRNSNNKIRNGEPYLETTKGSASSPHRMKRKKNMRIHQFQRGNYHDFHENRKILLKDFELSTPMKRLYVRKKRKRSKKRTEKKGSGRGKLDDTNSTKGSRSNTGVWVPLKQTMNRDKEKKIMNMQKEHSKYNGLQLKKPGKKQFLENVNQQSDKYYSNNGELSERDQRYLKRKEKFRKSNPGVEKYSVEVEEIAAGGGRRKDRVRRKGSHPKGRRRRRKKKRDRSNSSTEEEDDEDEEGEILDLIYHQRSKTQDGKRRRRRSKWKEDQKGVKGKKKFVDKFQRDPILFSLKSVANPPPKNEEYPYSNESPTEKRVLAVEEVSNGRTSHVLEDPRAFQRVHIQPIQKQGWTENLGRAEKEGIIGRRKRWEEIQRRRKADREEQRRVKVSKSVDLTQRRKDYHRRRARNTLARSANQTVESASIFGGEELEITDVLSDELSEEEVEEIPKRKKRRRKKTKKKENSYFESSEEEEEEVENQEEYRNRKRRKKKPRRRRITKKSRGVMTSEEEEEEKVYVSASVSSPEEETYESESESQESESESESEEEEVKPVQRRRRRRKQQNNNKKKNENKKEQESETKQDIQNVGGKKSYMRYNPIFGNWETIYV